MLFRIIIIGLFIYFFPKISIYAVPAYFIFLFIRSIIRKENNTELDPFLDPTVPDRWVLGDHDDDDE